MMAVQIRNNATYSDIYDDIDINTNKAKTQKRFTSFILNDPLGLSNKIVTKYTTFYYDHKKPLPNKVFSYLRSINITNEDKILNCIQHMLDTMYLKKWFIREGDNVTRYRLLKMAEIEGHASNYYRKRNVPHSRVKTFWHVFATICKIRCENLYTKWFGVVELQAKTKSKTKTTSLWENIFNPEKSTIADAFTEKVLDNMGEKETQDRILQTVSALMSRASHNVGKSFKKTFTNVSQFIQDTWTHFIDTFKEIFQIVSDNFVQWGTTVQASFMTVFTMFMEKVRNTCTALVQSFTDMFSSYTCIYVNPEDIFSCEQSSAEEEVVQLQAGPSRSILNFIATMIVNYGGFSTDDKSTILKTFSTLPDFSTLIEKLFRWCLYIATDDESHLLGAKTTAILKLIAEGESYMRGSDAITHYKRNNKRRRDVQLLINKITRIFAGMDKDFSDMINKETRIMLEDTRRKLVKFASDNEPSDCNSSISRPECLAVILHGGAGVGKSTAQVLLTQFALHVRNWFENQSLTQNEAIGTANQHSDYDDGLEQKYVVLMSEFLQQNDVKTRGEHLSKFISWISGEAVPLNMSQAGLKGTQNFVGEVLIVTTNTDVATKANNGVESTSAILRRGIHAELVRGESVDETTMTLLEHAPFDVAIKAMKDAWVFKIHIAKSYKHGVEFLQRLKKYEIPYEIEAGPCGDDKCIMNVENFLHALAMEIIHIRTTGMTKTFDTFHSIEGFLEQMITDDTVSPEGIEARTQMFEKRTDIQPEQVEEKVEPNTFITRAKSMIYQCGDAHCDCILESTEQAKYLANIYIKYLEKAKLVDDKQIKLSPPDSITFITTNIFADQFDKTFARGLLKANNHYFWRIANLFMHEGVYTSLTEMGYSWTEEVQLQSVIDKNFGPCRKSKNSVEQQKWTMHMIYLELLYRKEDPVYMMKCLENTGWIQFGGILLIVLIVTLLIGGLVSAIILAYSTINNKLDSVYTQGSVQENITKDTGNVVKSDINDLARHATNPSVTTGKVVQQGSLLQRQESNFILNLKHNIMQVSFNYTDGTSSTSYGTFLQGYTMCINTHMIAKPVRSVILNAVDSNKRWGGTVVLSDNFSIEKLSENNDVSFIHFEEHTANLNIRKNITNYLIKDHQFQPIYEDVYILKQGKMHRVGTAQKHDYISYDQFKWRNPYTISGLITEKGDCGKLYYVCQDTGYKILGQHMGLFNSNAAMIMPISYENTCTNTCKVKLQGLVCRDIRYDTYVEQHIDPSYNRHFEGCVPAGTLPGISYFPNGPMDYKPSKISKYLDQEVIPKMTRPINRSRDADTKMHMCKQRVLLPLHQEFVQRVRLAPLSLTEDFVTGHRVYKDGQMSPVTDWNSVAFGNEYAHGINPKTAGGSFDLFNRPTDTKQKMMDAKCLSAKLIEELNTCDEYLKQGVYTMPIYNLAAKSELLPESKPYPRNFLVLGIKFDILLRKYLGKGIQLLGMNPRFRAVLRYNPHSIQNDVIYRMLHKYPNKVELDVKTMDASISPVFAHLFGLWWCETVCNFELHSEDYTATYTLVSNICNYMFINRTGLYTSLWGLPSGHLLTAVFNAFVNHVVIKFMLLSIYPNRSYSNSISFLGLGDDLSGTVHDECNLINQLSITEVGKLFGLTYTGGDKLPVSIPYVSELGFLSRTWSDFANRRVHKLKKCSLYGMMHWQKNTVLDQEYYNQCMNAVLMEAFYHGHDFFHEIRNQFVSAFGKVGADVIPKTWEYFYQRWTLTYSMSVSSPTNYIMYDDTLIDWYDKVADCDTTHLF